MPSSEEGQVLDKLLRWPPACLFPALDIARLLALNGAVAQNLAPSAEALGPSSSGLSPLCLSKTIMQSTSMHAGSLITSSAICVLHACMSPMSDCACRRYWHGPRGCVNRTAAAQQPADWPAPGLQHIPAQQPPQLDTGLWPAVPHFSLLTTAALLLRVICSDRW